MPGRHFRLETLEKDRGLKIVSGKFGAGLE
jgi:hypothetical protein